MPIDIMAFFVTVPIVVLTVTFVYFVRRASRPEVSSEDAEPEEVLSRWQRARRIGYRASSVTLAGVFILTGLPKLTGINELMHRFSEWGYSEDFMLFIGISEFAAGILLLIPGAAKYAAGYLAIIMAGAIYTHLAFDPIAWIVLPAFCLSFLTFIAYEDWQRRASGAEEGKSLRDGMRAVGS